MNTQNTLKNSLKTFAAYAFLSVMWFAYAAYCMLAIGTKLAVYLGLVSVLFGSMACYIANLFFKEITQIRRRAQLRKQARATYEAIKHQREKEPTMKADAYATPEQLKVLGIAVDENGETELTTQELREHGFEVVDREEEFVEVEVTKAKLKEVLDVDEIRDGMQIKLTPNQLEALGIYAKHTNKKAN